MKEAIEYIKGNIVEIIIAIAIVLIIVLIIIGAFGGAIVNEQAWNNGYCECGGKWEYMDSTQSVRGSKDALYTYTTYIYKCNRCGKMHEFDKLR